MKYKTLNDKVVEGETLRDIAEALRHMVFVPDASIEEWMTGSAKRAREWDGSVIRTTSPEDHVRDLIEAGFLKPL